MRPGGASLPGERMQAVVPAAGEGTRMRPLTEDRPKGLVKVAGKPLLTHGFEALASLGVSEFVVVVGYRGDDIRAHYGESFRDIPITYVEQTERLGLAHALLCAESRVDGDFVLYNGDNVFRADLGAAVAHHEATAADATVLAESVSRAQAQAGGVFELEDGEPVGLVEKPADPPSTLATTGFFVFSPVVFHACHLVAPSDRGEYELSDAIDLLLSAGRRVEIARHDGWRTNVNTPADVEAVEERLGT